MGSRDVARILYGAIIGLALVVALQDHPPTAVATAATIIGTAVAVGLAEVYSQFVADEARERRRIRLGELCRPAGDALAVATGAGFPAVFFLLAGVHVIELDLAFTLAKWTGLGLICAYGFVAARLAGLRLGGACLHAAAIGAAGCVLIVLKALLH
jgi:hypothetical protein